MQIRDCAVMTFRSVVADAYEQGV